MKELVKGEGAQGALKYEIKIEDGKLKILAEADLAAGVDKLAEAIPGQSPVEVVLAGLIKQAILSI